jgi:formamidopyrimidine-DNA glycosylase
MPELPDLQVFSRNLEKKLKGKTLTRFNILQDKKLNVPKAKLKKALEGAKLKAVYREGKELRFAFANGHILGMHLMLKGRLHWYGETEEVKHVIAELIFKDQGIILTDYQKKASLTLDPATKDAPDALSNEVNYSFLKQALSKKKTNIKAFLLDQKNIRGIGNAYADEILWEAGISPFSVASAIPDGKIRILAKKIRSVLTQAEKQILKIDPNLITGEERSFLKIHNSTKKKSPKGGTIQNEMLNSRITYYTAEQELFE